MQKIVINICYGGFGLSDEAMDMLKKRKNDPYLTHWGLKRTDKDLVEVVEILGTAAEGHCAQLLVEEFDEGVEYTMSEYDGSESVEYYVPVTSTELAQGLSITKLDLVGKYINLKLVD
jgi:hypothetical protein